MNPRGKSNSEFEEASNLSDRSPSPLSEMDLDIPKRSPMRRKDKERAGGIQKKRKGNEKRKNSRLKYQYE
jgi:hypothetical protein